ncbi:MAG: hypothetical protein JSU59_11435 [Nitrospirota bacterium]|nr:MAG: hypothetical protein JSU59_11435 [Nitrospirota bacterium]
MRTIAALIVVWLLFIPQVLAQTEMETETETEIEKKTEAETEKEPQTESETQAEEAGYESEMRELDINPTDVEETLEESFPQAGSVFPQLKPQAWPNFKKKLYKEQGLALGVSYQGIFQHASESLTDNLDAAGGWFLLQGKWDMYNRGKDFQGSFLAALDWRHTLGNAQVPGLFRFQTGSQWTTDPAYFNWDPYFTLFFLEQWLGKERFVFRLGQVTAASVFDRFRFKDFRTQFSNSQLSFPAATIPLGPPAFGLNWKWWPKPDSETYVVGTITDINAPVPTEGRYDWSGIFETGEVLAGLEIGHNWKRGKDDYDHAHLDVWYASRASRKDFLSDDGWGFKVSGSKQLTKWVGFANYSYNTVQGGGFGFTNAAQAVNVGLAYLEPLLISGEVALAFSWGQPLDVPDPITGVVSNRDQWGMEGYWRILLTPDFWLTPGLQLIGNPSFNPQTDLITMPQVKFRIFL